MSATTMPGLELERIERLRRRLFVLALGPFEPAGAADAHHRREDPAADRMPPLRLDEDSGDDHKSDANGNHTHLLSFDCSTTWRLPHELRPRPTPNALPKSITKASRIASEPSKRVRAPRTTSAPGSTAAIRSSSSKTAARSSRLRRRRATARANATRASRNSPSTSRAAAAAAAPAPIAMRALIDGGGARGPLEAGVAHLHREHRQPAADGVDGLSRGRHLRKARQARRAVARRRHRGAADSREHQ